MRLFVFAFALGTLVLQHAETLPDAGIGLWGIAAMLGVTLMSTPALRVVLVVAGGFAIGYGYAAWRAEGRLADELPRAWEGRDIEVTGRVASLPQLADWGTRFLFDVEGPAVVPRHISLTWYDRAPALVAGETWTLAVRLKRPRGLANPHAFDFEPWALERGIRATGYVRPKAPAARTVETADGWPYTLHRWRGEIRAWMQRELPDARLRGVLVALAIGDQDAIAPADWDVFWRSGVGHLMSISGLHITMLAALGYALAHFMWVRIPSLALRLPTRKAAVVAGTLVALAYTLMTGYAVPAQRTFAMLAVLALCVLLDRHGSPSRVLALAALAVLTLDPWAALSAGFWLSFGAVGAIFYAMGLRAGRAGRVRAALAEQLAVTVVMLPMLLALFREVSVVSPLANAVAIPVVSLVVVPLAIVGAFLQVAPALDAAHAVMVALMAPLEAIAASPWAMLESHAPAPWTVGAALVGCAWLLAPRGVPMRAAGATWLLPLFLVTPPKPAWGEAWLDVLDVGNGLAVVVRTASHALAYDTGPAWRGDADSGGRIVVPYLRGEGIGRLDGLIISHADDDHAGGAMSLVVSRDPAWLLSPLGAAHPLHLVVARSIACVTGQRWSWDGVGFEVMHPGAEIYETGASRRKENDRSCVVRVAAGESAALLAGDAEARSEAEMLARGGMLDSQVLVVPHHGSRSSSTPAFVAAVQPSIAIFAVGYRNRFGHPHEAIVQRYASHGVQLRRTDREGALRIVLEAGAAPAVRRLVGEVRYWSERRVP